MHLNRLGSGAFLNQISKPALKSSATVSTIFVIKPIKAHFPTAIALLGVLVYIKQNIIRPTSGIKKPTMFMIVEGISSLAVTLSENVLPEVGLPCNGAPHAEQN